MISCSSLTVLMKSMKKLTFFFCNVCTDDAEDVIRLSDTDIRVIRLGNMSHLLSP